MCGMSLMASSNCKAAAARARLCLRNPRLCWHSRIAQAIAALTSNAAVEELGIGSEAGEAAECGCVLPRDALCDWHLRERVKTSAIARLVSPILWAICPRLVEESAGRTLGQTTIEIFCARDARDTASTHNHEHALLTATRVDRHR